MKRIVFVLMLTVLLVLAITVAASAEMKGYMKWNEEAQMWDFELYEVDDPEYRRVDEDYDETNQHFNHQDTQSQFGEMLPRLMQSDPELSDGYRWRPPGC